jgi:hypothetical protein
LAHGYGKEYENGDSGAESADSQYNEAARAKAGESVEPYDGDKSNVEEASRRGGWKEKAKGSVHKGRSATEERD